MDSASKIDMFVVNRSDIDTVKAQAVKSPLRRARICLHNEDTALIHEMIIAMRSGSYVQPHRNVRNSKSYLALEGSLRIICFDDSGTIVRKQDLCAQGAGGPLCCRLNSNCWHTVIPMSECAVFFETNGGPFVKELEEYASWAPEPRSLLLAAFMLELEQ